MDVTLPEYNPSMPAGEGDRGSRSDLDCVPAVFRSSFVAEPTARLRFARWLYQTGRVNNEIAPFSKPGC